MAKKKWIKVDRTPDWQKKKWFICERRMTIRKNSRQVNEFTTADMCIQQSENWEKYLGWRSCLDCNKAEYFKALKSKSGSSSRKKWIKVERSSTTRKLKRRIKRRKHAKGKHI